MRKEKFIEKAFGIHWHKFNQTIINCAYKHNGFISFIIENPIQELDIEVSHDLKAWRPKILRGIEYNNGWTVINSRLDLPTKNGKYWVLDKNGDIELCTYDANDDDYMKIWTTQFTHYIFLDKPKKPVY